MSKSKKELMIERTELYLQLHEKKPEDYPATISDVAEFVPCSRRLFYKADPEIQALVRRIEEAGQRDPPEGEWDWEAGDEALAHLTDEQLATEIQRAQRKAAWAMQKFLGAQNRTESVQEAPLVLYDLDTAVGTLRRIQSELRPLVEELQRRQRDQVDPDAPGDLPPQLELPTFAEE